MKKIRVLVVAMSLAATANAQTTGRRTGVQDSHDRYYDKLDSLQKAQAHKPTRQPRPARTDTAIQAVKIIKKMPLEVKQ